MLAAVRERAPLVQCITNIVTVNDCANILLAAGASATMAHHPLEVADAVAGVQALVLNLGAVGDREAMLIAGKEANRLGVPVIFDPVAAGFTGLRRETARTLLEEVRFAVIRGNASEIRSLTEDKEGGSGVDVAQADAVTESGLPQAAELASALSKRTGAAVTLSGAVDVIAQGERVLFLRNGSRQHCPGGRAGGGAAAQEGDGQRHLPHRSHRQRVQPDGGTADTRSAL